MGTAWLSVSGLERGWARAWNLGRDPAPWRGHHEGALCGQWVGLQLREPLTSSLSPCDAG